MTAQKQLPTLKTIATITGLAVPTVSRALSGSDDIGAKTRLRVQQVAKEVGYVPNRAGLRLRTGRSYVISVVLPTESDIMNVTARLITSAASALRGSLYHLTVTPVFPDEDPLCLVQQIVETRAADGLILNQTEPEDPRVAYLLDQKFPFATHGRSNWAKQHDYFDFDNYTYAQNAVARLAARGRRRLSLMAPPSTQFYAREMIRGAMDAAQSHGVAMTLIDSTTTDAPYDEIKATMATLFRSDDRPEGLVMGSPSACLAAATAIEEQGLEIGRDVDLYSKEAIPLLRCFRTAIFTQSEDANAAGSFLATAVLNRIETPDAPMQHRLQVPTEERSGQET